MWDRKDISTKEKLVFKNTISSEECTLSLIHRSEMGVYYVFDNPLQMPFQRKYAFELIKQHENLGLSKEEVIESFQSISDLCKTDTDSRMDVYHLAQLAMSRLKDSWDYQKTALMTAAVMIIEDGESIDYFTQESAVAKIDKWSKDHVMLAFFLSIAQQKLNSLTTPFYQSSQNASKEV